MKAEKYQVISLRNHTAFEFLSNGPNGTIKKVVEYQGFGETYFNLAFGDWDEASQTIQDLVRTNNNDRDKVLATVAFTAFEFMAHHPDAFVFVRGSTPARTRLYQMGIKANWAELTLLFEISGLYNEKWATVEMNKNYDAFSLQTKKTNSFANTNTPKNGY